MTLTPENIAPSEPRRRLDRIRDTGWRTLGALIPWAVLTVIVRTVIDPNWLPDDIGAWTTGGSAAAGYGVRRGSTWNPEFDRVLHGV